MSWWNDEQLRISAVQYKGLDKNSRQVFDEYADPRTVRCTLWKRILYHVGCLGPAWRGVLLDQKQDHQQRGRIKRGRFEL